MENLIKKLNMADKLNYLANIRGIVPLLGIGLIILSLIAQFVPLLAFLTVGLWLLHVGILVTVIGIMVSHSL